MAQWITLAMKTWEPEFDTQNPQEKLSCGGTCLCTPNTRREGQGSSQLLTGKSKFQV